MTAAIPAELACEDCPARVHVTSGAGLQGPVRIVTVLHAETCPWLARVAPDGVTHATAEGIVIHAAADPPGSDAS